VGRNFLIQQYLREGDYQLTVVPKDLSRGHLGISMTHTAIADGGQLTTGVYARAAMKAGQGLMYRFAVKQKGKYRIRAIGAGRTYVMRLEDEQGWPIEPPNIAADLTRELDVGEYRMIIPPEAVDVRVVASLEALSEFVQFEGHGPHHIEIGEQVRHLWREPENAQTRTADMWLFDLPAIADISIALNNEMQGELFDGERLVGSVTPARPWQGQLNAGQYRLAVTNARKNNHVEYQLTVDSRQLMIGQQRHADVPATIPIAVGDHEYIELWSYGQNDIRARLLDSKGNVVAQGDDRNNDWNFLIAQKLQAGDYSLEVEAVGTERQSTEVFMDAPRTQFEEPRSLPLNIRISDSDAHVYPLQLPEDKSLLVIQAESQDAVGLSIEVQHNQGEYAASWKVLGTATGKSPHLLLPYSSASASYRLRVWSLDRRGENIALAAQAIEPRHYSEQQLNQSDIELRPVTGIDEYIFPMAVAVIDLTRPGVFKVDDAQDVYWSSQPNSLMAAPYNGLVVTGYSTLWIAKRLEKNKKTITLSGARVVLGEQGVNSLQIALSPHQVSRLDIKAHDSPLLVLAESRTGRTGVQLEGKNTAVEPLDAGQFAIAQQSAVAVAVKPDTLVAKVWNAADSRDALEVNVRWMAFSLNQTKTILAGRFAAAVDSVSALPLALPVGLKRITLTLPPDTAAVLRHQGKTTSTHWSGKTSLNEIIFSNAHELLIMNAASAAQQVAVTIEPLVTTTSSAGIAPALAENSIYQQYFPNSGQLRLPVNAPGQDANIRLRGASQGIFVQHNGRIVYGSDLKIDGPGELLIRHQPGVITAWLDSSEITAATTPLPVMDIAATQTIELQGEIQTFQINLAESIQLHLRSDTPMITRVGYANGNEVVEAHPQGVNYSVYLPSGYSTLSLQRLGPWTADATIFISSAALTSIQEGYGPQTMLSGGSTQMYYFDIAERGSIGVGVQASSDLVSGMLLDNAGNTISHGVVHMQDLAPGRYILAISVPADSQPVRVRPALVGLERPHTGPPWEVIRAYLEQAGRKLSAPPQP